MATEAELAGIRERLFGLIDEEDIRVVDVPRPDPEASARLLGLTDLCSTVSDALDELGVGGSISSSILEQRVLGTRIVGPATTIRYSWEGGTAGARMARGDRARLADRDVYAVGKPGDVGVFDCGGVADASVMGGLSGRWARRLEMAGCVVDGAVRDLESIRAHGVPVWSRGVTPRTGKHRMRAIEINGPVSLAGLVVYPGDLIVADASGLCVVPREAVDRVVEICAAAEETEQSVIAAMAEGASGADLGRIHPPDRW
jgi:4-hydroxy-4-methyl-2-oxoglutarate aldolase